MSTKQNDKTGKTGEFGEGNYTATRNFDKAQESFVKSHKREIPQKGEEAKRALEGEEGKELRSAEERAKSHSHAKGKDH